MLHRLIALSIQNRFLVIFAVLLVGAIGVRAARHLPIDAVPDVTNVQVQVLTNAPALGPLEVEQFVTFPIETVMGGLPELEELRSTSKFGLSAVTLVFREGADLFRARQLVAERLNDAREAIPAGYGSPELGPITTGLGEIYQFEVRGDPACAPGADDTDACFSKMELRTILDWQVNVKLRTVPGVVEVNSFGGELKTYAVEVDPARLVARRVTLAQVFQALERNNGNAGGASIERGGEQLLVRGEALITSLEDLGRIVVADGGDGVPVKISDVARPRFAPMVRQGAVTRDGRGEAVTGIAMMLMGENSRTVAAAVRAKIESIQPTLPKGVVLDTFYDRTELVERTIHTVAKNLIEGGVLVIVVLLLLLGSWRAGLLVASAIPLSMLAAFIAMNAFEVSGNLMSLGAIDFGLIVDGSVVIVENVVRTLAHRRARGEQETQRTVLEAAQEVARPVLFAVAIIIIVYVPLFTLEGVEGKMFRPMAFTVVAALLASLVLALTLMPAMTTWLLRNGVEEKDTWLVRQAHRVYEPLLSATLRAPKRTLAVAGGAFVASLFVVPFLGAEFIPRLDEGAIAMQAVRLPSISLSESIRATTRLERLLLERFPDEVSTVVSKTGRAEIATDPMGVEISDVFVMLKPIEGWTRARTQTQLVEAMDEAVKRELSGQQVSFSQPIELRTNELISGVRSDVAISVYGDDLDVLKKTGDAIVRTLHGVDGAADVKAEQTTGLPFLRVQVDRERVARYGIDAADVLDVVSAMGGRTVGEIFEGQRRFPLQVRFAAEARLELERIRALPVAAPDGTVVPLGTLAKLVIEEGPAQVSREKMQRRLTIEANVRGRDLASFVADAQEALAQSRVVPEGYTVEWGGQFEHLEAASGRLAIAVPLALLLIFVLLFMTWGSAKTALLVYLNVPFATTGGILALALRGMPFSISAAVGFIALFGVAVLNGVVLISQVRALEAGGAPTLEAAREGAWVRMRPVLMTALVASFGFIPMALATSAGAEVQRPLATVVLGGLVTSTLLTLLVLPSSYAWVMAPSTAQATTTSTGGADHVSRSPNATSTATTSRAE